MSGTELGKRQKDFTIFPALNFKLVRLPTFASTFIEFKYESVFICLYSVKLKMPVNFSKFSEKIGICIFRVYFEQLQSAVKLLENLRLFV